MPILQLIVAIESGLSRVQGPAATDARNRIVGILRGSRPPSRNLSPDEAKALRNLREDNAILVLPADKGRAMVVLDRSDYDEKIHDLLSDEQTYVVLRRDLTQALERRMNKLLLSLKQAGTISRQLHHHLHSSDGKVPLQYGLPKTHKPGVPLCPIVSFLNSPTYNLSRHLVSILSPLVSKLDARMKNLVDFAWFARS